MILQKIQQEFPKKYSKNILVRITQIWQNNSSIRTSKMISTKSKNFSAWEIYASHIQKINTILTALKKTEEKKTRKIPEI
jgi:hypothetical protein